MVGPSRLFFVAALVLAGATAPPARALIPGGGPASNDCFAEFGGTPANYPAVKPKEIRCTDGDPSCDQDPNPNVCGIAVAICLNVVDAALPTCTPHPIELLDIRNYDPTSPKFDPAFFSTARKNTTSVFDAEAD